LTSCGHLHAAEQTDLFARAPARPEGFAYRDDAIAPADEAALLAQFQALPFKPFEFHGYLGNRRVIAFGWRYDYAGRELRPSDPIPSFLLALRAQAASFAGIAPESLQQVLINEYAPGAGIGWHRDKPMFEEVIAISLGAPCTLRLRRKHGNGWQRFAQTAQPRSAYLLRGASRQAWEHSVPPVARLRYSVTFRNFAPAVGPPRNPAGGDLAR
jgi:alkylated DNA repair dioxygenase AlkB